MLDKYRRELSETCKLVAEQAREQGHDLHLWNYNPPNAWTACRRCGQRVRVTVTSSAVTIDGAGETCGS